MELIDKTALVAEIERRIKAYQENFDKADNKIAKLFADGLIQGLESFLAFLDTFEVKEVEEEPISNDLEEAAHLYVDTTIEYFDSEGNPCCYSAFKAGAQWQREQMITKACMFLKSTDFCKYYNKEFVEEFKKAMEE